MSLCPTKKRCYLGPESASRMVDVMRKSKTLHRTKYEKERLNVYKCGICTFFHIGKQREGIASSSNWYVSRGA